MLINQSKTKKAIIIMELLKKMYFMCGAIFEKALL